MWRSAAGGAEQYKYLIGRRLVHSQPRMVPSVAFTLGLLLTFGEPAIGSLIELSYEAWDFPEIQALLGKHTRS